ncbi:MAG: adenylosuccinate synthase [Candidatus Levybacteria bacterium]|nr:adenylosuccinate synthase [Candidatus Levybacteria bacterium]
MPATIIIGAQWGDEGKGKIIDYLSQNSDYVVRFHGGNNAGHTVINDYGKFALHLIPSGIFQKKTIGCISNGTVLDLEVLLSEIEMLKNAGIDLTNKLFISPRCHIIMPYHKVLDKVYEEAKGKQKTGTTGRGIGPVYADKVSYNGIRIADLLDDKLFSQKLETQLRVKNKIIIALGEKPLKQEEVETYFAVLKKKIKPFVNEPYPHLQKALKQKKNILLEGAQGVFLDNDWGTYPFVTGSTVLIGGANAGAGIAPKHITNSIGVAKAYATRVGSGPFPTELLDSTGEKLRTEGAEFGTTTGRPRRCGWFDAALIRFAAEINGLTSIAITKLDILDSFSEIKICTGYEINGKRAEYYDGDSQFLEKVKPIYKTMKGWNKPTKGLTKYADLPKEAKIYLKEIEKQTGISISFVSTGQKRHEIIKI